MPREVGLKERMWRVIGFERGSRKVWRYTSEPDAIYRARHLHARGKLIEFSHSDVEWGPVESTKWQSD